MKEPSVYRQKLMEHCRRRSSAPIANRYPWHCREALDVLAAEASRRMNDAARSGIGPAGHAIRIITESMSEFVFTPAVWGSLLEFLRQGGRIHILIWNEEVKPLDAFVTNLLDLDDEPKKRFCVRVSHTLEGRELIRDLFLLDGDAYRLEASREPYRDAVFSEWSPEIPARICFHDPSGGSQILRYFDQIWQAVGEGSESKRHLTGSLTIGLTSKDSASN